MLILHWCARLTLFVLAGLSVWSVAIMIDRRRYFRDLMTLDSFEKLKTMLVGKSTSELKSCPGLGGRLFSRILAIPSKTSDNIDRAVRGFVAEERIVAEKGLTTLATLGANAPFIGLFGTVLGIIEAFGKLGTGDAASSSVMTAISEALIATAVGLFVAIPAVVAFNIFSSRIKEATSRCEILKEMYLSQSQGANSG